MTEADFNELLMDTLTDAEDFDSAQLRTFEDGMVLTMNQGLTVRFEDGTEFQVTVVRSR